MTITLAQFDGQYDQTEVNAMNAKVTEVLEEHGFSRADLSQSERASIMRAVEHEVSGCYDRQIGWSGVHSLMPAQWGRLIEARR